MKTTKEAKGWHKLTVEEVEVIREFKGSAAEAAKAFGISRAHANNLRRGIGWGGRSHTTRYLDGPKARREKATRKERTTFDYKDIADEIRAMDFVWSDAEVAKCYHVSENFVTLIRSKMPRPLTPPPPSASTHLE